MGPEKPDYETDVFALAKKLGRLGVADVKFAARGTAKHIVLVVLPTRAEITFAGESILCGARPDGFSDQPGILVAVDGGRAAWLPATGDLHPTYVQGYIGTSFGVENDGTDALTTLVNGVARFLYGAALAMRRSV